MVDTLSKCLWLNAKLVNVEDILHLQMNKLAVNAVLNPLTALLECDIGTLYSSRIPWIQTLIEQLLNEMPIKPKVMRLC